MSDPPLQLGSAPLTFDTYRAVTADRLPVRLSADGRARMERARRSLLRQLAGGKRIYGVNTGYGADSVNTIAADAIRRMQQNTLRSHAVGTGALVAERIVRGMLLLKAAVLAQGYSAVRPAVVELLLAMLEHGIHPLVPEQGSLAASGDLIPCGHLGLALLGEGEVLMGGAHLPAAAALQAAGLQPLALEEKEGLALVNGTAFSAALAIEHTQTARTLLDTADHVAAASLQALRGFPSAYDARLVSTRPFPGALAVARTMRALTADSSLLASRGPGRVHDPYCLRCIPPVHGASRDAFSYVESAVAIELNAFTDNPLVFWDEDEVVSGGNFHAQPIALPMDTLALLVAELGSISQRRTQLLVAPPPDSGLPAKLSRHADEGLGLFMLNTAAAALVAENRTLLIPASADSMAVDAVEDHVSMASVAARKAALVIANTARILAIELLCACQGLDLQRPLLPSPPTQSLHAGVRELVPFVDEDRPLADEIAALAERVLAGTLIV